jgi:hypothetical protein
MKITVIPKEKKQGTIPYDEIPVGTVYEIDGFTGTATMLKLECGEAVFLSENGANYFQKGTAYKGKPAAKILGKLKEIIVEKK